MTDRPDRMPRRPAVDVLSDVLRSVRLTGSMLFLVDAHAAVDARGRRTTEAFRRVVLPASQHLVSYHIVTHGRCWAGLRDAPPERVRDRRRAGRARTATPTSWPTRPARTAAYGPEEAVAFFRSMAAGELPSIVREGGDGAPRRHSSSAASSVATCGRCNPVLDALPRMIHLRAATPVDRSHAPPDRVRAVRVARAIVRRPGRAAAPGRADVRRGGAASPRDDGRRRRPAGWPVCTIRWSRARCRCCTARRRAAGRWRRSRRRPAHHVRCWPNASRTSSGSRRCSTSRSGACSWRRACSPSPARERSPRWPRRSATNRRRRSAAHSRSASALRRPRGGSAQRPDSVAQAFAACALDRLAVFSPQGGQRCCLGFGWYGLGERQQQLGVAHDHLHPVARKGAATLP